VAWIVFDCVIKVYEGVFEHACLMYFFKEHYLLVIKGSLTHPLYYEVLQTTGSRLFTYKPHM